MTLVQEPKLYGLVAEFSDPDVLLTAAKQTHNAGYRKLDAFSPFPVHGLSDAIAFEDYKVPWTVFFMGLLGVTCGFAMQIYVSYIDYPLNVGGRPMLSWPQFIPVAFECTILFAAYSAVFGMLAYNGFPRPYQSIFNTPRFDLASQDRFFLAVESEDPKFDIEHTEAFLRSVGANTVSIVQK
ncbi:MAG: DUF3341 domain-containing protein [Chthonomonadaceae bacterium]|nr:DUF3341 domain-containing protein [Chthonomonadaceae bacterium]